MRYYLLTVALILLIPSYLLGDFQNEERSNANNTPSNKIRLQTIIVDKYYPYTFVNKDNAPDGFSVDLIKAVTQAMSMELEIRTDTWEKARNSLQTEKIDFLPMMAYSTERDKIFDFSVPHTIAFDGFFTRKESDRIRSIEDLRKKTIVVMKDDQAHDYLRSIDFITSKQLILIDSLPKALRLLASGKEDAALMPKLVGLYFIKDLELANLEPSPIIVESYKRPFSFAVKEGNLVLLERLSQGLSIVKETGQYKVIYEKWFGALEPQGIAKSTIIKYAVLILLPLILLILTSFIWTRMLKKEVSLRTKKLESEITERKKVEEEIRRSKILLESSIKSPKDMIILSLDREYRYLYFNKTHEESMNNIYGAKPRIGDIIFDHMKSSADIEQVKAHYDRAMSGESHSAIEEYGEDLARYYYEIQYNPIHDEKNEIIGVAAFAQNITERKKSDDALMVNEEKFRNLFNNAEVGMFRSRLDGSEFLETNDKCLSILGCTREEVIGKPTVNIWADPKDREEMVKTLKEKCQVDSLEFRTLNKAGEERICLTSLRLYPETGILEGSITDITERKKAEENLAKSESKYRLLFESSMDAVMTLAPPDWRFTSGNPATVKMFGARNEEEFTAVGPGEMSPEYQPDGQLSSEKSRKTIIKAMEEGSNYFEWTHKRLHGEAFPATVLLTRFRFEGQDLLQATVRDTTEQKRAEEKLQQMQKLESIGILAGGIAHDFNNMLAGIITNIYLSKMDIQKDSDAFKNLESAEKAILRARDLTQRLLTFARGGAPVTKAASIEKIIKESTEFVLTGSNVICDYHVADGLWPVEMDEGQISQVIQNIVLNSSQAMPEGGTIQISIDNIDLIKDVEVPLEEGQYVKIVIQDKGTGMSEEHLNNIFDLYFTTKDMGRGLGLSIAYSVVKSHKGHISVESEMGTGTAFTIYLPASEKPIEEKEKRDDTVLKGHGKILLMDDEEMIQESMGRFLEISGYEVEYAKEGNEAIALYKKATKASKPFDAVILDLTIRGGMGGKETIIKLLDIDPNVKAIVSSGYSNDPIMADFREYGFRDVIAKPCNDPNEIIRILHNILKT